MELQTCLNGRRTPADHAAVPVTPGEPAPDLASCNVSEAGWAELWSILAAAGVGVEAGVWSPADLDALVRLAAPGG